MTVTAMTSYPRLFTLGRTSTRVTVRPLEQGDAGGLLKFFGRVPAEDRFYLKEDVTSPQVIDNWVNHIDFNRVVPLVALVEDEIVADATLHWSRAGARRHVGEVRVVVDPRYRDRGLGTLMVEEVVDLAHAKGLDSVVFELVEGTEDNAIKVAERLGFTRVATLPNFVNDMDGTPHNLVVMLLPLENWLEWSAY